jgi:hypothetical protein
MTCPTTAARTVVTGPAAVPVLAFLPPVGDTPAPCSVSDTAPGHPATYPGAGALISLLVGLFGAGEHVRGVAADRAGGCAWRSFTPPDAVGA